MHVRYGLLAVLLLGPGYGQQLAREFERRSGTPLNVGQVSATLDRLARAGLVADAGADPAGRRRIGITLDGREAVEEWAQSGADDDSGSVLALLAAVDGSLAQAYASARASLLADLLDAPSSATPPAPAIDGADLDDEDVAHRTWRDGQRSARQRALAEAEHDWLIAAQRDLEHDPGRYELPLGAEPRRGRPHRTA